MTGPLSDIKVLDFSTLLPGPMATLFLAEAGADVIKVERPGNGDEMRGYVPRWGDVSVNFALLNRGKKSIAVDLKDPAHVARLTPLLREADILVEQYRPGVMERFGLGFEAVQAINPDIIYCSITGYGQSGPKRDVAGHDLNYIGDTGLLSLSSGPCDSPVVPPALIADIAAGTYPALLNILLALRQRDCSGEGAYLDIAMADNLFPFMYWALGNGVGAGQWPGNGDALVTGGSPRYQLYPTKDDRLIAAAPLESKFWQSFCDAIGLNEEFRDDARDPNATRAAIAHLIRAQTSTAWASVFAAADCCCSVVKTVEEAFNDPHFAARRLFTQRITRGTTSLPALPVPIVAALRASEPDRASPGLGAHTETILSSKNH